MIRSLAGYKNKIDVRLKIQGMVIKLYYIQQFVVSP
jgi:hypothetical protein